MKAWALFFVFLFSVHAFTQERAPLLFGPEFTFLVPKKDGEDPDVGDAMIQMAEAMKKHLVDEQEDGAKFKVNDYNRFESPNGWVIRLTTDGTVIEAKMDPMTVKDFEKYGPDIQDALFETAYKHGFYPALYEGGGHISLSAKYFAEEPRLLANFIIDTLNHSELGMGIWNYDTNNALPLQLVSKRDWAKIINIVDNADSEQYTVIAKERSKKIVDQFNQAFREVRDPYQSFWRPQDSNKPRGRFTAINLKNVRDFKYDDSRIELRMFRPQPHIDVFISQIKLLEARIQYLENNFYPVKLKPNFLQHSSDQPVDNDQALTPPIDPQWALNEFYYYVVQSGEKLEDHLYYIWPQWLADSEHIEFLNPKALYGPEFTFSRLMADEKIDIDEYKKKVFEHLVSNQPEGQKFKVPVVTNSSASFSYPDNYTSPNGWSFKIEEDAGSIEIQMPPMSLADWEKYEADIQDAIFVSAANTNHFPAYWAGGGHLNIDFKVFRENPLLYRNFLADLYNHNELFLGILNYDTSNSISPHLLGTDYQVKFQSILDEFDLALESDSAISDELSKKMVELQDSNIDNYAQFWPWTTRGKYQAVNLEKARLIKKDMARIEIRGIRPQASAQVFINQARLFEKRIQYLKQFDKPIPLKARVEVKHPKILTKTTILDPPVDPMKALESFHQYLNDIDENWMDHREYLWPEWLSRGIVDKYEKSVGIVSAQSNCESLLVLP